jgi:hypothetical protein
MHHKRRKLRYDMELERVQAMETTKEEGEQNKQ